MRKRVYLFLVICLFNGFYFSQAQLKVLAESEIFGEPKDGEAKVIQLSSGITIFYLQDKKSITLQLFDVSHKKIGDKNIQPAFGLKDAFLNNLFELEGKLILFFTKVDDRIPKLFRLTVDGATGNLIEEKLIEELPKMGRYAGFAFAFGRVDAPGFYVTKDYYSNHYAVAKINTLEEDRGKRIEIILLDGNHKEIGRSYYSSPVEKYKYMRYVDMVVYEQNKVALLMSGYNTKRSGGEETASYVAVFSSGKTKADLTDLKFEKDRYLEYGSIQYNPVSKELVALALGQESETTGTYSFATIGFSPEIITCDPSTGKVIRRKAVTVTSVVDETINKLFDNKTPYRLVPQNLLINDDGSYTVLCEDLGYFIPQNSGYISSFTVSILMSRFSSDLNLQESYLIPKSHWLERLTVQPFYVRDWGRTTISLEHSNGFKSFSYLNSTKGDYTVFNDIEENGLTVLKGKVTNIKGVSQSDAFVYQLKGKEAIPPRDFVFTDTDSKKNHQLLFSPVYTFDKARNLYITLKLVKGKKEGASLVWMSPQ